MSYLKNNLKKKLSKFSDFNASPIFIFGSDENIFLTSKCQPASSISKRVKQQIEILKKTASALNLTSLSCNQIFSLDSIFIMNRHVEDYQNSGINGKNWYIKSPLEYQVFINPKLTHVTRKLEKDIELCASFPFLQISALRFNEIKVNYYSEQFEEVSEVLSGFKARIFQHEYDHLTGTNLLDWRVCQGEIEIIEAAKKDYPNFEKALVNYRKVVEAIKNDFPDVLNYYENDKNFGQSETENGLSFYKYSNKAFRRQELWSKEIEIMKGLQQSAEIDFNLMIVIFIKKFK